MSKGKWLGSAFFGAIVGAIGGILFAPRSGKETRGMIKDKASELGDKTKEALDNTKDKAKNFYDDAKDKIAEKKEELFDKNKK